MASDRALCVRQVSNWSVIKPHHRFDSSRFDPRRLARELASVSPKVKAILENIERLDAQDMSRHGHTFKHFIFSDLRQMGYGAKMTASALLAHGWHLASTRSQKVKTPAELLRTKGRNIGLLSSTATYKQPPKPTLRKHLKDTFNLRPDNVHGDLIRIMVLDSGFKEGINLFDVRYMHMLEPQTTLSDQKQAVGRGTRTCGQRGLTFDPLLGWPLYVYTYDATDREGVSMHSRYMALTGINVAQLQLASDLEAATIAAAVDADLTVEMHKGLPELVPQSGGALPMELDCSRVRRCKRRPTREVPASHVHMLAAWLSLSGRRAERGCSRLTLCKHLRRDREYCERVRECIRDPKDFMMRYGSVVAVNLTLLLNGPMQKENRARVMGMLRRSDWFKSVRTTTPTAENTRASDARSSDVEIQPQAVDSARPARSFTQRPTETAQSRWSGTAQVATANSTRDPRTLEEVADGEIWTARSVLTLPTTLADVRAFVRKHSDAYRWPPMRMENKCTDGEANGVQLALDLHPTQAFLRHWLTPASPFKGALLWASVGAGKTCAAVAVASAAFEPRDYTILWVTTNTLREDVFAHFFDWVCHEGLRRRLQGQAGEDPFVMPANRVAQLRLLGPAWRIRPMSYKQLNNALLGRNEAHRTLVERNGLADPLRKTLIIIDEAHKLYSTEGMNKQDRIDTDRLMQALQTSYSRSGNDSARVLLMTATPYTRNPMDLMKLLNLLRDRRDQLPTDYDDFKAAYLDDSGTRFTAAGRQRYGDAIAGYVSYLNSTRDARQFAQPVFRNVVVPISMSPVDPAQLPVLQRRQIESKAAYTEANLRASEMKCGRGDLRCKELKARLRDTVREEKANARVARAEISMIKRAQKHDDSQELRMAMYCTARRARRVRQGDAMLSNA